MLKNTKIRLQHKLLAIVPEGEMGCWRHYGVLTNGGYGQLQYEGGLQMAHRVAYKVFCGEIPEGFDLDHLCRNRWCVNPWHVEPVTRTENILRGERW